MLIAQEGLADRLARHEPGAEDEFVRSYSAALGTVLRARLRDPEAAREVANDVLLAVLNAIWAGRLSDRGRLSAFVMGTARNLANSYRRRRARRPLEEMLADNLAAADTAPDRDRRDRMRSVFDEVQHLDDTDRAVVGLTLAQGLKPAAIARALRLSPQVVRTRKCRAIRRLAQLLQPTPRPEGLGKSFHSDRRR
jgi:RNA polymerase sigma-70 factor, ECF subfamily